MGRVLWTPTPGQRESAPLTAFAKRVAAKHGVDVGDYEALWRWSVEHLEDFWAEVWEFFDVAPGARYETVLAERRMPGAVWFSGARLNYTHRHHSLGRPEHAESTAQHGLVVTPTANRKPSVAGSPSNTATLKNTAPTATARRPTTTTTLCSCTASGLRGGLASWVSAVTMSVVKSPAVTRADVGAKSLAVLVDVIRPTRGSITPFGEPVSVRNRVRIGRDELEGRVITLGSMHRWHVSAPP